MTSTWRVLICATALAGCSASGNSSTDDASGNLPDFANAADFSAPPDIATVNGYPAPPYGPNVGDVVPDFTFQGYFSPTATTGLASAQTFGPVVFDQVRKTPGAKYMLFWFAGFT
jgi:hypothetical protein